MVPWELLARALQQTGRHQARPPGPMQQPWNLSPRTVAYVPGGLVCCLRVCCSGGSLVVPWSCLGAAMGPLVKLCAGLQDHEAGVSADDFLASACSPAQAQAITAAFEKNQRRPVTRVETGYSCYRDCSGHSCTIQVTCHMWVSAQCNSQIIA